MRPTTLDLKGFGTFREPTTVDFEDVDLAAVSGPTGAGKSTIVDALTFALYGSVTRYDDARLVAPVINSMSNEARVRLDFEVEGVGYTAVRVVRRTKSGGATTKEARLQRGDEVVADDAKGMTSSVEELLGLSFNQFTKTIVLPQGEFATFLHDSGTDRQALLRQLLEFGVYEEIGRQARGLADRLKGSIDTLARRLEAMGEVSDEELDQLRSVHADIDKAATKAKELAGTLTEQQVAVDAARAALDEHDAHTAALSDIAVPTAVESLGKAIAGAQQAVSAATEHEERCRSRLQALSAEAEGAPDPNELQALIAAYQERDEWSSKVAEAEKSDLAAAGELERATAAAGKATTSLADTTERLETARHHAGLATYQRHLVSGEPCPLCQQPVDTLPSMDAVDDVEAAEAAVASARSDHDAAAVALRSAGEQRARTESVLRSCRERLADIEQRLAGAPSVDELAEQLAEARKTAEQREEGRRELDGATSAVRSATSQLDELRTQENALRAGFGEARDAVVVLDPPQPSGEGLADDWQALARWAEERAALRAAERKQLVDHHVEVSAAFAKTQGEFVSVVEPFVDTDSSDDIMLALAREGDRVVAQISEAEKLAEERATLSAELASSTERFAVANELGQLLKANGFERWLMDEVMDVLIERASARLMELSSERYQLLHDDGSFLVVDHQNAGERRDVKTLSGGETFLASLSLALALSDSIAELAPASTPRFETIVLDEGFGALDVETLDVAASAVEELGASGRMVIVVTHIAALAERLPTRFIVGKGPSGSTVTRTEQ